MGWQPTYCSVAELKSFSRVSDSIDDAQFGYAVEAASRAIDRAANRQFGAVAAPEARYYGGRWDRHRMRWIVSIDDLMTTSGIAVGVDSACDSSYSSALTAYDLKPLNAAQKGRPWTELVVRGSATVTPSGAADEVRVTALWGWTAVPTTIKQAALLQASRLMSRRDSPNGVAGSPAAGSELRLLARLDPDVEVMVRTYWRPWSAVASSTPRTYAF